MNAAELDQLRAEIQRGMHQHIEPPRPRRRGTKTAHAERACGFTVSIEPGRRECR
jgi:hypothetical protein